MTIQEQKEKLRDIVKDLDDTLPDIKFMILAESEDGENFISGNFCPRCALDSLIQTCVKNKLMHLEKHELERVH